MIWVLQVIKFNGFAMAATAEDFESLYKNVDTTARSLFQSQNLKECSVRCITIYISGIALLPRLQAKLAVECSRPPAAQSG